MGKRSNPGNRRSAARLAAVQALYQIAVSEDDAERVIAEFASHRLGEAVDGVDMVKPDRAFFYELVRGVVRNRRELDDMIAAVLVEDWTIERLEILLVSILRAGAHELADRSDVPARVVISEYVDLADAFYGDKETGLVNGVLDRLARELRPDELGAPGGSGKTTG
ncbi:MAG: transcription antitermination protein NusB [Rhodospirillaceae bacterium]|jgi:N utilization substance protein B|nr:transcription antitermination protein NusB [Rhodospirillaceae bacterium]